MTEDGPLPGTADTTRWRYDNFRRVIGVVSPSPGNGQPDRATRSTYDVAGRLVKVERGTATDQSDTAWAAFTSLEGEDVTYDGMDRKLKDVKSGGGTAYEVTQYSYDVVGRLLCTAVRMDPAQWSSQTDACTPQATGPNGPDRVTKLTYDAAGQLVKTQKAYGTVDQADEETNSYTVNGKVATLTDGQQNTTSYTYDGHDRLAKSNYPLPTQGAMTSSTTDYEQLTYDANSNVTQRRLRDAKLINNSYDALDRITTKTLPSPELAISYTYDNQGRLLTATQGTAVATDNYDGQGRMASETTSLGSMQYQYDNDNRRTRTTWPDGFYVTQDFLTTGEVSGVHENGATSGPGLLATFSYDALGRRAGLARGNGTSTSFGYDAVSRLASLGHSFPAAAANSVSATYGYNPANQISTYSRDNDVYAWNGHYNVTRPYLTNGLNQYTTVGTNTIGYDLRGNLTTSGTSAYGYTSENRMVSGPGGVSLAYDPTGRLSQTAGGASGVTRFQYDGSELVAEYNSTGIILRRYVHGVGTDAPLIWYEGTGTTDRRWFHQNEQGSVVNLSNASGASIAINSYDEYGIPASRNIGRFQYTGQTWVPEIGMYYYKARIYSPTLGRFMQTDPIGYKDGPNWYEYVANDPVDKVDYTGTESGSVTCMMGACNPPPPPAPPPPTLAPAVRADGTNVPDPRTHQTMLIPTTVSVQAVAQTGATAGAVSNVLPGAAAATAATLFCRGCKYDVQRVDSAVPGKIDKRLIATGNYLYGVFAASSGMSRAETLAGAAAVNVTGSGDKSGPLGSNPTNNISIWQGYTDSLNNNIPH